MRIDKYLSNLKYGTRKEVQIQIKSGLVKVNDIVIKNVNSKINEDIDLVKLNDETVYYKKTILLIMNKPSGYLSANENGKQETVYDLIKEPYSRFQLNIAGRLDKDTEGLLILTNNGTLLHSIITPKKNVYKKYYVKTKEKFDILNFDESYQIKDGRDNLFTPLKPIAETISDTEFHLSIKEGKFHQIKRMVQHFNNEVIYLKRLSIGKIVLDQSLKIGEYKELDEFEL